MVAVALANRTARSVWAVMALPSQGDRRASGLKGLSVPQDCEGEEDVMILHAGRLRLVFAIASPQAHFGANAIPALLGRRLSCAT